MNARQKALAYLTSTRTASQYQGLELLHEEMQIEKAGAIAALKAELAPAAEWQEKFDELLEDYVMSRVETALWNVAKIQPDGGIRMVHPRRNTLLAHMRSAP